MSKLLKTINEVKTELQTLRAALEEHTQVINQHAHQIEQNKAALETIINWVGSELGEEAVERLGALMGWTKPDAANEESRIVIP